MLNPLRRRILRAFAFPRREPLRGGPRRASQVVLAQRVLKDVGLAAICVLLIIAVFYWRPFAPPDPTEQPAVGQPAQFLEVYPLDKVLAAANAFPFQEPKPLTVEDLAGQVALVFFWNPRVDPSVDALRRLAAVLPIVSRSDFRFLGVACPLQSDMETPGEFLSLTETTWKDCAIPLPCYLDPYGSSRTTLAILNQRGAEPAPRPAVVLPTAVLIDTDGLIRAVWEGWIPNQERDIARVVEKLLGPRATPPEPPEGSTTSPHGGEAPTGHPSPEDASKPATG